MPKYHITSQGNAGLCRAKVRCPFGDMDKDHYATAEVARQEVEKLQTEAFGTQPPNKSDRKLVDTILADDAAGRYNDYLTRGNEIAAFKKEALTPGVFTLLHGKIQDSEEGATPRALFMDLLSVHEGTNLAQQKLLSRYYEDKAMSSGDYLLSFLKNPSLSPELQLRYAEQKGAVKPKSWQLISLADNPNLTEEALRTVASHRITDVYSSLARKQRTLPTDVRQDMIKSSIESAGALIRRDDVTTEEALAVIDRYSGGPRDDDQRLRRLFLESNWDPNYSDRTSQEVLERIVHGPSKELAKEAEEILAKRAREV